MDVQIRILDSRLYGWGFPRYGSELAAGLDLCACIDEPILLQPEEAPQLISAGISILINDPGWFAMIAPRSGWAHGRGLVLGNTIGVIDADYSGICQISAWNRNPKNGPSIEVKPGDRIAQMIFLRTNRPNFSFVDNFIDRTPRGEMGFGSTGD